MALPEVRAGDIGFGPISGRVGALVGLGQLILGDELRFRHVYVMVAGGELAVEAMPTGARLIDVTDRRGLRYVYLRPPYMDHGVGPGAVARHAMAMIGTPYGFADYLALALKRVGAPSGRLDRYISRTVERGDPPIAYPHRAICSQLADQALTLAGMRVFTDGRLSQNVTPGALFYRLLEMRSEIIYRQDAPTG